MAIQPALAAHEAKAGRSGLGALVVFAFAYVVFDNLALAIIAGLLAAGVVAARSRGSTEPQVPSPYSDRTE